MQIYPTESALNTQVAPMDADLNLYGFPPGYFIIKNVASERLLDIDMDMVEDGTRAILWPETETSLVEGALVVVPSGRCRLLIVRLDMRKPNSNNQVRIS